jgi:RNA polymerase sigma-70 factor (ECF subfamily)
MVLRACRAALRNSHAAEDAFQATFLVLVRRAGALPLHDSLGPWLFGVARRVCARARADAARHTFHEQRASRTHACPPDGGGVDADAVALIHDAVGRLPEALRAAVVLCDLEGLTYQQAAERLGWTHDTVRGRLARARQRLRQRLVRLGFGPEAALAVVPAEVPRALLGATVRLAAVVSDPSTGTVPIHIILLMNGGLQSMFVTKLKSAGLSLMAAGVLAAGAFGLSAQAPAPKPAPAPDAELVYEYYQLFSKIDLAERIAELARQAKQKQEAGDTEGALKVLREIENATREWQGHLEHGANVQKLWANKYAQMQKDYKQDVYQEWLKKAPYSWTEMPGGTAKPEADLESRLREVERKLERLLKAMEDKAGPRGRGKS